MFKHLKDDEKEELFLVVTIVLAALAIKGIMYAVESWDRIEAALSWQL